MHPSGVFAGIKALILNSMCLPRQQALALPTPRIHVSRI
jgi:hypothetical protein